MALGFQPSAGVDGTRTVQPRAARESIGAAFALRDKTQIFRRQDFGDGEAVMDFGELDIGGGDAGHFVGFLRGLNDGGQRRNVVFLIERHLIGGLGDASYPHRLACELGRALQRSDQNGGRAIAD